MLKPQALNFYQVTEEEEVDGETTEHPGSAYLYGAKNLCHTFSANLTMNDWKKGLSSEAWRRKRIEDLSVPDFVYGSPEHGQVRNRKFDENEPEPLFCSLVIKHANQGKISSHQVFFKGFCRYLEPEFCQILDAGTIPLWDSLSHILLHMQRFP